MLVPFVLSATIWSFILLLDFTQVEVPPSPPIVIIEEPEGVPVGVATSSPAPYLNSVITIGVIATAGAAFIYIFKKMPRVASLLAITMYTLVSIFILYFYLIVSWPLIRLGDSLSLFITSIALALILAWCIRRGSGISSLIAASVTTSSAGVLMGSMIPPVTSIVLLVGIAIFDFLMVSKGYLSVMEDAAYQERVRSIKGFVFEIGDITLGLGDPLFYSVLIASMFFNYGFLSAVMANLGIFIGFYITLRLLKVRNLIPGLPIPISLGLALGLTSLLL